MLILEHSLLVLLYSYLYLQDVKLFSATNTNTSTSTSTTIPLLLLHLLWILTSAVFTTSTTTTTIPKYIRTMNPIPTSNLPPTINSTLFYMLLTGMIIYNYGHTINKTITYTFIVLLTNISTTISNTPFHYAHTLLNHLASTLSRNVSSIE